MTMLLHACCACCLARALAGLRAAFGADLRPLVFFHNPNIHPLLEFRRRLKAVRLYRERDPVETVFDEAYGLIPFCETVHAAYEAPARCARCYALRLGRAAREAAERGLSTYTTTLTVSRHQDHALIRAAGEEAARREGVEFLYHDLREAEAPDRLTRGLYRQSYCGCVFSEAERFAPTAKYLYKGENEAARSNE